VRLTQSSVPQLMFAGPGEPAGATADNYPRDTSHVATTCTSAPMHFVHLVAPYRIHTHRKKHTKSHVRDRPPRAQSHKHLEHIGLVTTDCPASVAATVAGTDRDRKPPGISTWRALPKARRVTRATSDARIQFNCM